MNSQSTSNWPVLCYVNKLIQRGLYLLISIVAKSKFSLCQGIHSSSLHNRCFISQARWMQHFARSSRWVQIARQGDHVKCHVHHAWLIKCRLFRLPLIQNVVQHLLIVTSLQLCYSPSIWWFLPLGNDFDILILILMTFLLEKLSRIVWKQPFSINHRLLPCSCESCVC